MIIRSKHFGSESGRSLIEMLGVLGIIGLISLSSIWVYQATVNPAEAQSIAKMIQTLVLERQHSAASLTAPVRHKGPYGDLIVEDGTPGNFDPYFWIETDVQKNGLCEALKKSSLVRAEFITIDNDLEGECPGTMKFYYKKNPHDKSGGFYIGADGKQHLCPENATCDGTNFTCLEGYMQENDACIAPPDCGEGRTWRDGACRCNNGKYGINCDKDEAGFEDSSGRYTPCDTIITWSDGHYYTSYNGVTEEQCAQCDGTDYPRQIITDPWGYDYCALVNCPTGYFRDLLGECWPCDSLEIGDVTNAEGCSLCDNTEYPRKLFQAYPDDPDWTTCGLRNCGNNYFQDVEGSCHECSLNDAYFATQEQCDQCNGTAYPRKLFSVAGEPYSFCSPKNCENGYYHDEYGTCTHDGCNGFKSGNSCVSCNEKYGYDTTQAQCDRCPNREMFQYEEEPDWEPYCVLKDCGDGYYHDEYRECYPCPDSHAQKCDNNGETTQCKEANYYLDSSSGRCKEDKCFGITLNSCQESCNKETGTITPKADDIVCLDENNAYGICNSGQCSCPLFATCDENGPTYQCDENHYGDNCEYQKCTDYDHKVCPNGQFCKHTHQNFGTCTDLTNQTTRTDCLGGEWVLFGHIGNVYDGDSSSYKSSLADSYKSLCISAGYAPVNSVESMTSNCYSGLSSEYVHVTNGTFYPEYSTYWNNWYGAAEGILCEKSARCTSNSDCTSGYYCDGSDNISRCVPLNTGATEFSYNGNTYVVNTQKVRWKGIQNWCSAQGYTPTNPDNIFNPYYAGCTLQYSNEQAYGYSCSSCPNFPGRGYDFVVDSGSTAFITVSYWSCDSINYWYTTDMTEKTKPIFYTMCLKNS